MASRNAISYIVVIIIWSTTPLAIKLSNDSVAPIAAIGLRMVLAVCVGVLLLSLWALAQRLGVAKARVPLLQRRFMLHYLAGAIAVFPNMPLVYYAATTISSGLISVLFGLAPIVSCLFAQLLLGEKLLTPKRVFAQCLALIGLLLIFVEQLALDAEAWQGMSLMLLSVIIYSFSNIWVKRLALRAGSAESPAAFEQALGAMLIALPGLLLSWYLLEGSFALELSATSLGAISYLAFIGSLVGLVAFYYIVSHLSVAPVAMIPVLTPVFALLLGNYLMAEPLTGSIAVGGSMIVLAMMLHENVIKIKRT